MRIGNKIGQMKVDSWKSRIEPRLQPGEKIECMIRTKGMIPMHDQMIVTTDRIFVNLGQPMQPPKVVFEIDRGTLTKIAANRGRIELKGGGGKRYDIPLHSADDAPLVLEVLSPGSQSPAENLGGYVPAAKRARGPQAKPSFKADHPPRLGATVPEDCVWAKVPYPGPLSSKVRTAVFKENRVKALDPVARPLKQIISVLGKPNSVSTYPDGTFMHQWQNSHPINNYHVALIFDRYGVCSSIAQMSVG